MYHVAYESPTDTFNLTCDTAQAAADMFMAVEAAQSMRCDDWHKITLYHEDEHGNVTIGRNREAGNVPTH